MCFSGLIKRGRLNVIANHDLTGVCAASSQCSHGRRGNGFGRSSLKLRLRNIGDAQRSFSLVLGQTGVIRSLRACFTNGRSPSRWSAAVATTCWWDLLQKLAHAPIGSSLNAHRQDFEAVVFSLPGVAGECCGFVRPGLALIDPRALGEGLLGSLVNTG